MANLVSNWADQSGNGRHLAALHNNAQLVTAGGKAALEFAGNDVLSTAAFELPRVCAAFVVLGTLTARGMVAEHGNGDGFYLYAGGAAAVSVFNATGATFHRAFQNPPTSWAVANASAGFTYDGIAPPVLYTGGAAVSPTSTDGAAAASPNRTKILHVGGRTGPSLAHTGHVRELVIVPSLPSAGALQRLHQYFLSTWGVA